MIPASELLVSPGNPQNALFWLPNQRRALGGEVQGALGGWPAVAWGLLDPGEMQPRSRGVLLPLCPALQSSCLPAAAPGRVFLRPYLPYGFQLG